MADRDAGQRSRRDNCDLVMKGGATSGLVYPRAILELKEHYSFRAVGGTSAGAIVACLAAAAEFHRGRAERGEAEAARPGAGFEGVHAVSVELESSKRLQELFAADPHMEPLAKMLEQVLRSRSAGAGGGEAPSGAFGWARRIATVATGSGVRGVGRGRLLGLAAGVLLAAVPCLVATLWAALAARPLPAGSLGPAFLLLALPLGAAGAWVGGVVAALRELLRIATRDLPANYFGVARAHTDAPGRQGATDWLHEKVQSIAGLAPEAHPLTFRDLTGDKLPDDEQIKLRVVSTDLNEQRPLAFPTDEARFVFCQSQMRDLFPAEVVDYLVSNEVQAEARGDYAGVKLPDDFFFLPVDEALPVVVAARMSMAFPLYFSAIPLYTLPARLPAGEGIEVRREDLIPHWFSDGGIASNFPIHFFDSWIPAWPTFGITLRYMPAGLFGRDPEAEAERRHFVDALRGPGAGAAGPDLDGLLAAKSDPGQHVWLPQSGARNYSEWLPLRDPLTPRPGRAGDVVGFLGSVVRTMQNYRDNTQAALPSYSDRVAQVRLQPGEGGFNLAMKADAIKDVQEKGRIAGQRLRDQFRFDQHQWVRFCVLAEQLEKAFARICGRTRDGLVNLDRLHTLQRQGDFPCAFDADRTEASRQRVEDLLALMEKWHGDLYASEAGGARPVLRVTPHV